MGEPLKRRLQQSRFENVQHEAVLNLIVAASHVRARIERVCAEHGITEGQYNALRILRGVHPEGYPRCDIARRLIERAPDVTRLIDRLEKLGWVERSRSGTDRRLSITRITCKGLAILECMQPAMSAVHHELIERMSDRDARELSRICEAIYDVEE